MAQKNSGLRVEDLKPPPVKHRRISSTLNGGRSPSGLSPSPAYSQLDTASPRTPLTDIESPPKDSAKLAGSQVNKGKGPLPSAMGKINLKSEVRDTPSPIPIIEEPPSMKRKREQEEAILNPDAFIQRTLQTLSQPFDANCYLSTDITGHLPFDFDPVVPPIHPEVLPLLFSVPNPPVYPPVARSSLPSQSLENSFNYSFDFLIDPSASAFREIESPFANTPDLVKTEDSPASDDGMDDLSSSLGLGQTKRAAKVDTAEAPALLDWEKWLVGGPPALPSTFAWEGDLTAGTWNIYPEI